jgi:hypothetical protein
MNPEDERLLEETYRPYFILMDVIRDFTELSDKLYQKIEFYEMVKRANPKSKRKALKA